MWGILQPADCVRNFFVVFWVVFDGEIRGEFVVKLAWWLFAALVWSGFAMDE